MKRNPALRSVAENGPAVQRHIAGICSLCGDTLLAWAQENEEGSSSRLRQKLDRVFNVHITEKHSNPAGTGESLL